MLTSVQMDERLPRQRPALRDTRLLILPPSDYALEFADVVEEISRVRVEGFVECLQPARCNERHDGREIVWVDDLHTFAETHAAACAMGTTQRDQFIRRAEAQGISFPTLCHPSARVSKRATLGTGAFVDVSAVVSSYSKIGRHTRVKRGAIIGHHTTIGDYVSIQPGANIAGHCNIDRHVFVGMSAVVLDHIKIGEHSVVGAGAVVTKHVPPHVTVVGCPARVVKERAARESHR